MKIISFNIGIKINNSDKVVEYLRSQAADIICIQEAMRPLAASVHPMYRSAETIIQGLPEYPYYFFAPEWVADKLTDTTGVIKRDFGGMVEQGKLILSKYPIIHGYNHFYYKAYELDSDRTNFYEGNDHARALQIADIAIGDRIIRFANVHGTYSADKLDTQRSLAQSNAIIERLKIDPLPTILLGDFNLQVLTTSMAAIEREYENINKKCNVSVTRPDGTAIDYIFTTPDILVNDLHVDVNEISDHYPLIADIDFSYVPI